MKNKAMLIGAIDAGKTTIINELIGNPASALKTQVLQYHQWIIDTPGEYTENPLFYKNIMATALEVTHVVYVQDATTGKSIFPPGFSGGIPKLPIALVTKEEAENANVDRALQILRRVMLKGPVIITSAYDKKGIEHIKPLVACNTMEEMRSYVESQSDPSLKFFGS